jgi:hypothetical protein
MYTSALSCADDPASIFFALRIDTDDAHQNEYRSILRGHDTLVVAERAGLCSMVNEAYSSIAQNYDMFCPVSDDLIFRTPHWDTIVKTHINSMPCPIGLVWGDGGTGRPRTRIDHTNTKWANIAALPTWFFVTKEWISVVGYFLPPYFYKDYADTWYLHLISNLEVKGYGAHVHYLENDLMIEHMHPSFGKAAMDETYEDTNRRYSNTGIYHADRLLFDQYYSKREEDSQKIISRISELSQ